MDEEEGTGMSLKSGGERGDRIDSAARTPPRLNRGVVSDGGVGSPSSWSPTVLEEPEEGPCQGRRMVCTSSGGYVRSPATTSCHAGPSRRRRLVGKKRRAWGCEPEEPSGSSNGGENHEANSDGSSDGLGSSESPASLKLVRRRAENSLKSTALARMGRRTPACRLGLETTEPPINVVPPDGPHVCGLYSLMDGALLSWLPFSSTGSGEGANTAADMLGWDLLASDEPNGRDDQP